MLTHQLQQDNVVLKEEECANKEIEILKGEAIEKEIEIFFNFSRKALEKVKRKKNVRYIMTALCCVY